jgi:hypothetical protein
VTWSLRRLLEESETVHRRSAERLRALGQEDQARRAEQFAAGIRFDLDEPRQARRLYAAMKGLREVPRLGGLFSRALEGRCHLPERTAFATWSGVEPTALRSSRSGGPGRADSWSFRSCRSRILASSSADRRVQVDVRSRAPSKPSTYWLSHGPAYFTKAIGPDLAADLTPMLELPGPPP